MATTLLSPRRYLRQGYGLSLPTGYTLSQLRSALIRAQNQVTRYCNAPRLPQAFDWRGGTMTDEQHQWKITNPLAYGPGARRVYVNAGPVKTCTALALDLGKTYLVTLDPATDIYVNHIEQYVEVVAVAPTVVGFYPLAVNLGLYNPIARISYTYGWTFDVAGDVLEAESPTQFTAAYGNWSQSPPAVIYLDGVEQGSGYTVNFDDGTVTFTTAPGVGVEVTADYTYTAPSEVVDAIGYAATAELTRTRMNARGLAGLSSLKVAEISMSVMNPAQMVTKNGATIPVEAAALVGTYVFGSASAG
jgi:hypothetical protein